MKKMTLALFTAGLMCASTACAAEVRLTELFSPEHKPRTRVEALIKGSNNSHLYGKVESDGKFTHKARAQVLPYDQKTPSSMFAIGAAVHYVNLGKKSFVDVGPAAMIRYNITDDFSIAMTPRYFFDRRTIENVLKFSGKQLSVDTVTSYGISTHKGFVRYGININVAEILDSVGLGKIVSDNVGLGGLLKNVNLRYEGNSSISQGRLHNKYHSVGFQYGFR